MPAYKDKTNNKWFAQFYCRNWQGDNKLIKKRGFNTKREALDYERIYKMKEQSNLNMTFENFFELYSSDKKPRLKLNTWLTKEHIVATKIIPYFKNRKINEITAGDIVKWQNELIAYRNDDGKPLSETYRKTIHNQLSAIFNHAMFYDLKSNPARKAGNMGKEQAKEMLIWTKDEKNRWRNVTVGFRMSPEEAEELNVKVRLSGLSKQDYLIKSCLEHKLHIICGRKVAREMQMHLEAILDELQRLETAEEMHEELLTPLKHILEILNAEGSDL